MKKRKDPLYRQWLILQMLPTRTRFSTNHILDRLVNAHGISTTLRTVQRDLNDLEDNFPIICDGEKEAGWSWSKDAPAFGIANLDPATVLTFKLAEQHLERLFPRGTLTALEPYFKAANDKIKKTESTLSHWPDKIRVVSRNLSMIHPQVSDDILDKVYAAVLDGRRFSATYRAVGGKTKEYDVNPLGMAFVEGLTYLVATLNEHDDPLLLLLHRILDVKPTDTPVTIPGGFNLDEYTNSELSFPIGDDIKLKVFFNKKSDIERLRETQLSEDQKITERDGGWLVQATVSDSYQLRWWLRGYGDRVEIVGPKSLRQEFVEMALGLAKRYAPSDI
jgi:predicted DNA-binding transcriptional regulator YafY